MGTAWGLAALDESYRAESVSVVASRGAAEPSERFVVASIPRRGTPANVCVSAVRQDVCEQQLAGNNSKQSLS